ncbi:MAG: aspartate ammonia-lyase [Lachnospirales bacterium]
MNSCRTEKDYIGEKQVPKNAYYGIQTVRALENFTITGHRIRPNFIYSCAIVKKACALANMDAGYMGSDIAKAIAVACDKIITGKYNNEFLVDPIQGGAGTSFNMNVNEVIANLALEHLGYEKGRYDILSPNTHVNMAQSTNDVFPTTGHITIHRTNTELLETLRELKSTFILKAKEFDSILKMGRTHLQDAVPIRLGQEFMAYSKVLSRDITRIENTQKDLLEINIGATAVGTGLNADPYYIFQAVNYINQFTGEHYYRSEDLVDATQNTDCYTTASSALKICMVNMSKIANDLRLMASGPRCGFNEINLEARQPGSSIMPGKVNPVMIEAVNQVAFQVMGNDLTISLASEAGQFELNVMEPVLFFNLVQSIEMMTNVLKSFNNYCLKSITANEDRLKAMVENSVGIVTALAPHLGYEEASQLAKEVINSGKTVKELCLEKKILPEDVLNEILDGYSMTNVGVSGKKYFKKVEETIIKKENLKK